MRAVKVILTVILLVPAVFGQQGVFDFLRADIGARASAMNGSFVSVTDDPNVLFYNPASLATISSTRLSFSYFKHLLDISSGSAAYAGNVAGIGSVGFGVLYFDYGSFTAADATDNETGNFGASDLALVGGWGSTVDEHTSIGLSLEYIYSRIAEYRSTGIAVGCGVLYQIPSVHMTLGASILHLGKQMTSYDGVTEPLPLDVTIGLSERPEHLPVLLSLNFHRLNDDQDSFLKRLNAYTIGAEFTVSPTLLLRGGYSNQQKQDLQTSTQTSGFNGFSFGAGLLIKRYQIDYSYNSYGIIGGLHHFSVGMTL
jgi:hypothetical protein